MFNNVDIPEADEYTPEVLEDTYLNMDPAFPKYGQSPKFSKVTKIRVAFEIFYGEVYDITPGYKQIDFHLIFVINMGEKFKRKDRMVAGGHKTDVPSSLTCSYIVSCYSVPIFSQNQL